MLNDYFEFNIAGHFLPALINGDDTGLEDDESKLLDQFADHWQALKNATWDCVTHHPDLCLKHHPDICLSHHPDLNICDITGLLAATHKVRLYFTNDNLQGMRWLPWTFDAIAD
jgi:hypothetical protein